MAEIIDLITFTAEKNPTAFQEALDEILGEKAIAALEAKRVEIAQSIYTVSEEAEEEESLEEISNTTLKSYVKKASRDVGSHNYTSGYHSAKDGTYGSRTDFSKEKKSMNKADKRQKGIDKAVDKMTKEEAESLEESKDYNPHSLFKHIGNTYAADAKETDDHSEKKSLTHHSKLWHKAADAAKSNDHETAAKHIKSMDISVSNDAHDFAADKGKSHAKNLHDYYNKHGIDQHIADKAKKTGSL